MIVVDFKVGDRVRCARAGRDLTNGKEYFISRIKSDGIPLVLDDVGDENAQGSFELVQSATEELAALRAFKETALASGYVPPEPPKPETDEEAAGRIDDEYWQGIHISRADMLMAAMKWARANPR